MADQSSGTWWKAPVIVSYVCSDPQASIEWFGHLGFEPCYVMRMPDGSIAHADLARGDARIMIGPNGCGGSPGATGMQAYFNLVGESVDALHDRAKGRVEIGQEPTTQFWGDRTFEAIHPDGYKLTFSEHVRDV